MSWLKNLFSNKNLNRIQQYQELQADAVNNYYEDLNRTDKQKAADELETEANIKANDEQLAANIKAAKELRFKEEHRFDIPHE